MRQTLARWLLGAVFVAASLDKIRNPVDFADSLAHYRLLPGVLVPVVALSLPWLELLAGAGCIMGLLTDSCALILAILCGGFEVVLTSALVRGLDISCGCFHAQGSPISWLHPVLDLGLLGLAILVLRCGPGQWALDNLLWDPPR